MVSNRVDLCRLALALRAGQQAVARCFFIGFWDVFYHIALLLEKRVDVLAWMVTRA